jgi:hypothetical protein
MARIAGTMLLLAALSIPGAGWADEGGHRADAALVAARQKFFGTGTGATEATAEAARLLRVNRKTLYDAVRSGEDLAVGVEPTAISGRW